MYGRRLRLPARARLRVGVAAVEAGEGRATGHGTTWTNVLSALREQPGVRIVDRGRADVWLASGHDAPASQRPLVVQVHEVSWRDPQLLAFLDPGFAEAMEQSTSAALSVASHVIVPSEAARRQTIAAYRVAEDRIHAVPHGVDHALFRPGLRGGRELVGGPYVLWVAVLHPRKNFAALREAMAGLAQAGFPHRLAMVGNPPPDPRAAHFEHEATAAIPGHAGRLVHLRDVPSTQLSALMAGADVFCLPSFYEGFGLPALEAMACGAPLVVSDRGALPEVVGQAGLLSAPDGHSLLEALRSVLSDSGVRSRMRAASVARAAGFSWERTAEGWLEVLRRAAEEG